MNSRYHRDEDFLNFFFLNLLPWTKFRRLNTQKEYQLWRQIKIKGSPDEQPFKSVWELVHLVIVIIKRGVYFSHCEDGAVWHLIPRRISPCSESFLGHIGTGILCGVNLGLDWPPLARGFQTSHYTHTHTHTRPRALSTPRIWKIWTSRFWYNNINYSSRQLRFPV